MLQSIRAFFSARGVLEVETPLVSASGTTDPYIESFRFDTPEGETKYLQTSPEFAMKRLLAAGSGDIYQISKAFRAAERGRLHNPEFTMLEWYRIGIDHHALMQEVVELIYTLRDGKGADLKVSKVRYSELCQDTLGLDPLVATVAECAETAQRYGLSIDSRLDRDGWLDLLLSHVSMPSLPDDQLTVLCDYPASQASLAKLNDDGQTAARFEVFWGGVELANGFYELSDAAEQDRRFTADQAVRRGCGQHVVKKDDNLIQALDAGFPECAGVALGVDRLLMKVSGLDRIDQVLAFPFESA